jgi:serine/threonine protein phosphatase PrpC
MSTLILDAFWGSDAGRARDHNEDTITGTARDHPAAAARGCLFVVADGMGGHNAGEVASREAAQRVYDRYYAGAEPDVFRSLEHALRVTNNELYQEAQSNPAQHGMGTTLTAAVIKDDHLTVAHVGDSRLYLIRGGKIEQVTHDHSWVEEQVRAGALTRQQAESHPQRNVITRALASGPDVRVDAFERDLRAGDVVVFGSDGLTTEVDEAQIAAVAIGAATAQEGVQRLIQLANDNGGEDNISVGLIRVLDPAAPPSPAGAATQTAPRLGAPRPLPLLPLIGGIVALIVIVAALVLIAGRGGRTTGGAKVTVAPVAPAAGQPTSTPAAPAPAAATATPAAVQPTVTLAPTSVVVQTTASPARLIIGKAATPSPEAKGAPAAADAIPAPALVEPPRDETVKGQTTFRWEPVALPAGAAYEVVWWRPDEDPDNARGFAPPTIQTSLTTDLEGHGLQPDQVFYWTVLVVRTTPTYRRLQAATVANGRLAAYK